MSLLLDALKKAELAKQIAKAESGSETSAAASAGGEQAAPVITREKLPDITRPLEIVAEDLPRPAQERPDAPASRSELSLQELQIQESDELASDAATLADTTAASASAERKQARQVFEVKEMNYNPRRPFYITLGALGLVGVSYAGYVWWQTRPTHYYSTAVAQLPATPARPAPTPPPTQASPQTAPAVPAPGTPQPPPVVAKVQEIPPIQPTRPPRARKVPQRAAAAGPARQTLAAAPRQTGNSIGPSGSETPRPISVNARTVSLDPEIERGYLALQNNDLATARESYRRVLAREPVNRDALLGLAAVALRTGDLDSAEAGYLRLLELDPRDAQAAANLIALHGQLDPVASESRLKTLLASQPDSGPLHFVLGNQYARQSRWSEAQEAYFKAYSVNPDNADYAFNLAVSLDQLRQKKPALEYYQRALQLAEKRSASFNPAQVQVRVQELSK
jgi:tetratricopeptide (TPR) repeat protein